MTAQEIIIQLKSRANPHNVSGMASFGINPDNTLGIPIPYLRGLAKNIGKNHKLAQELWDSGIHEARLLAGFIDDPKQVSSRQMDAWTADFDSWDICDQVCSNLFDRTPLAYEKAFAWAEDDREFIKRAGFVMMAALSVHDKNAADEKFLAFFPLIQAKSDDNRNFVKKAVNWALRQIGKRNENLMRYAITFARELEKSKSASARWIAKDALREFNKRIKIEQISKDK